ncbi:MAG: NifB/NifX family molybdenum-iron cluster-binding protein [Bacteroidales bacterium]
MILAFALREDHVDSLIDPGFGRCSCFGFYDSETSECRFVNNISGKDPFEAGIRAAELVSQPDVRLVIAGRFGLRAMQYFNDRQIQMVVPAQNMKMIDVVTIYNRRK